jgi:hypothetical protein
MFSTLSMTDSGRGLLLLFLFASMCLTQKRTVTGRILFRIFHFHQEERDDSSLGKKNTGAPIRATVGMS